MTDFFNKESSDVDVKSIDGVNRQGNIGDLDNTLKKDREGLPETTKTVGSNIADEAMHSSSPLNTLASADIRDRVARRSQAVTEASGDTISDELSEILEAVNPEDHTQFANPRYFEQTGNRKGFTLYAEVEDQQAFPIQFDNGIYVTSSIAIVEAINRTIRNNRANVSAHIVEISAERYKAVLASAAQASRLRSTNGPVTTSTVGGGGRAPAELEKENAELRDELAAMKAKTEKLSSSTAFGKLK